MIGQQEFPDLSDRSIQVPQDASFPATRVISLPADCSARIAAPFIVGPFGRVNATMPQPDHALPCAVVIEIDLCKKVDLRPVAVLGMRSVPFLVVSGDERNILPPSLSAEAIPPKAPAKSRSAADDGRSFPNPAQIRADIRTAEQMNQLSSFRTGDDTGRGAPNGEQQDKEHGGSLRILVLEDDYLTAERLTRDLRRAGINVIGPFADPLDARQHLQHAHAAIFDILLGGNTSIMLAQDARAQSRPFIFYSGLTRDLLPPVLQTAGVYGKPSPVEELLSDLRAQQRAARNPCGVIDLLPLLLCRARLYRGDPTSAEKLVEAVLERGLAEVSQNPPPARMLDRMLSIMHGLAGIGPTAPMQ